MVFENHMFICDLKRDTVPLLKIWKNKSEKRAMEKSFMLVLLEIECSTKAKVAPFCQIDF